MFVDKNDNGKIMRDVSRMERERVAGDGPYLRFYQSVYGRRLAGEQTELAMVSGRCVRWREKIK